MENKRKATLAIAAGVGDDDRASKRRKVPAKDEEYDLLQGETADSTTHYGQQFLDLIRRTSDKSGRLVATHFESLLPKEGNEDYYAKIRMPISLEMIEEKLVNREFANLSELESYVKRMVCNAKDYYDRRSQLYDDAERVRKALSNYMTKKNPAYKLNQGYTAVATPISDHHLEVSATGVGLPSGNRSKPANASKAKVEEGVYADGDRNEDVENEEEVEGDADAEGEEDEDGGNSDEDGEGDDDSEAEVVSRRRRGPGRPPRKPDTQYEGVPYKGLGFQEAQEKIIEELLRKKEHESDDFSHFEPFLNLPPRQLRDYYQVIKEPICLKKLQKLVRGIHSRRDKPSKSDFKSWAAFEEKASLLWKNAYFYNEDGSEIALLAKELEDFFYEQLNEAKSVVQEPPQPRLKLKVSGKDSVSGKEPTTTFPKKITIHVAPGNSNSGQSPAPLTTQSMGSVPPEGGINGTGPPETQNGTTPSANPSQPEATKGGSLSAQSPAPSTGGRTDVTGQSPAVAPLPNGAASASPVTPGSLPNGQANPSIPASAATPQQNGQPNLVANPALLYDLKERQPGRGLADALINKLTIRTHPMLPHEPRFRFTVPASPRLAQQSAAISIPASHWKVQLVLNMSHLLFAENLPFKLYVIVNGQTLSRVIPLPNERMEQNDFLFDAQLHVGLNKIVVQIIAAVSKDVKLPNGADAEFESITVLANLVRQ